MLATTPPPVKPPSSACAIVAAPEVLTRIAIGRLRKLGSLSSEMALEGLKSKCGGELGAGPLHCRMAVELFCRSQPEVCIS
jgi:hypothetical protein